MQTNWTMMTEREAQTCASVMCRVKSVSVMRRSVRTLKSRPVLTGGTFVTSLAVLAISVSIPQIISNMANLPTVLDYVTYVGSSFLKTSIGVQSLFIIATIACGWFAWDVVRNVRVRRLVIRY